MRILFFCENFTSDSYSAIHTVHLDQHTNHQVIPAECSVYVAPSTGISKPRQAIVLTGVGDFREAQVNVPLSVSHYCV